jgi:hypothetical protein
MLMLMTGTKDDIYGAVEALDSMGKTGYLAFTVPISAVSGPATYQILAGRVSTEEGAK